MSDDESESPQHRESNDSEHESSDSNTEQERKPGEVDGHQPDVDELPAWLKSVVQSAEASSGSGSAPRAAIWIPTLVAGWRAIRRGLDVSVALREQIDADEALEWPDELIEELMATIAEFGDSLPGFDAAVPALTEVVEFGEEVVDAGMASEMIDEAIDRLRPMVDRALQSLFETAFFGLQADSGSTDPVTRNRHLQKLFRRLEELFDRLLYLWLFDESDPDRGPGS